MNEELEKAFEIICNLNERAHERAWDLWVQADELEQSSDEDDWEIAEDKREEASETQAEYFRAEFQLLDETDKELILKWLNISEALEGEFKMYYGEAAFDDEF